MSHRRCLFPHQSSSCRQNCPRLGCSLSHQCLPVVQLSQFRLSLLCCSRLSRQTVEDGGGQAALTSVAPRAIVQQVAAKLAERLPRLRQCNSAVTPCPCKPAGPLPKGMLFYGECFFFSRKPPSERPYSAHHARRASAKKHTKFGGLLAWFAGLSETTCQPPPIRDEMRSHS